MIASLSNVTNIYDIESLVSLHSKDYSIDYDDPLGMIDYSYLEFCNIEEKTLMAIEADFGIEKLLYTAWQEEASTYWLTELFRKETSPKKKFSLLKIACEEHKHFMLWFDLAKILYPDQNCLKIYENVRDSLPSHGIDTSDPYAMFKHFHGEVTIATEIKYEIKNTKNLFYRDVMKFILSEESGHLNEAKKFNFNIQDKEDLTLLNYRFAMMIVHNGIDKLYLKIYDKICKKYNIDINNYDMLKNIKLSKKSKDYVSSSVEGFFKLAKSLNLIDHDDFEKYLIDSKIFDRYQQYL